MSEPHLIQTKLHPPRVTSPLVDRPRLRARLDSHPGRLVLVSAPAGFGKTVLVADWLSFRRVPTAWFSLDRLDNDPSRFCSHLAASIGRLDVPGADRAAALIAGLPSSDLTLPPALFDALAEMGSDPVIVLDDLHELESPGVLAVVESLVRLTGPGPRVVVLTRVDPPFATGRLRVSGELLELRERELRFTDEEAVQLFDRLLPHVLDPDSIRRLGERTEGWVAGLRLAAIALQDAENPGALADSFAGTHRYVMDYLLEEALQRQTPEVQQFLLNTSILRRFSPETCAAVTGDTEARKRLQEVEKANLFLVPLESEGTWYRYHHLFAELLRFRLMQEQEGRVEELHRRASLCFEAEGDVILALEHASQMEDRTRLLELLDTHAIDMLSRSQLATLRQWFAFLPEELPPSYPMLVCVMGWFRVVTQRSPDMAGIMKAIRLALEGAPADYNPALRKKAAVELEILTAFGARHRGNLKEALAISERVLQGLDEDDDFSRGLLTFNMGRVQMMLGEMRPAGELLEKSFDASLRSGNFFMVLSGLGHRAAIVAQTEGVQRGLEFLAAAVSFAEERGLTAYPAFSTVLFHRGEIEFLGGKLDRAERDFQAAVELGRSAHLPEGHANGLVGLARVHMARRSFDRAEALLLEAAALGQGTNLVLVDYTLAVEQSRLAYAREAAGVGPPVSPPTLASDQARWTTVRETESILAIWQLLRAERFDAAGGLIDELEAESEKRGRGPAHCTALIARALLPEVPDRWESLDRALRLAGSRGYLRPFLDGGEPARALIRSAQPRSLSQAARVHARRILERFDLERPEAQSPDEPLPSAQLVEPLTEREEEVLACLFLGQSNKAIASSMFVSIDTVKTHLKHVYAKLDVTGRGQAVTRARELGLGPKPKT